ncbi:hypothetical protein I5J36_gp28 [Mycobacterium phage Mendokysei]|uniref:Uncharacterized protein n=1 Tax=Mycobacterium phage Mendokysei TaxID=2099637 RepID=A0A2P1CGX3_9CAUD|nr:hypothetical protein I5J36_gp28 [Mycobacterium phage Mendokysei]AVJ50245.1 hypothetical protein SEA_MENDOKYSEI_28 [Mycobacterium phage Mendokysei]
MSVESPDTVYGLAAVVAVQLFATIGGIWHTTVTARRGNKQLGEDLSKVKHHVVNDHGDRNLRTDVDRLIELGEENARLGIENQKGIAELRGELRGLTHRVDQIQPPIVHPRTGW